MMNARSKILRRKRITNTLLEAVESYPLIVLAAPAGYGKTTESNILTESSSRKSYFTSIPQDVASERQLAELFLSQLQEQGLGVIPYEAEEGHSFDEKQVAHTTEMLANHFGEAPSLLIIDDCRLSRTSDFHRFIELLTRKGVPNLCIVLLTRSRPSMQLEDLRIKGMASVFGQGLLKFSMDETIELFQLNGVDDAESAELAWRITEGWGAALWLSLQSYHNTGLIAPVNDLEKLISETIFSNYSIEDQAMLLQLSLLEHFTIEQAVLISGDGMAKRRLMRLYDSNAFLTYGPDGRSYRMHGIFRSYLSNLLEENSDPASLSINKADLYRRAGECSLVASDCQKAIEFFYKAGRPDDLLRILQMFEASQQGVFITDDPQGVAAVLESIPWDIRRRCVIGYLTYLYFYTHHVSITKGLSLLNEAEADIQEDAGLSEVERRRYLGEIEAIRALQHLDDFEGICRQYEKAYALLQKPSSILRRHAVWLFHVFTSLSQLKNPGGYKKITDLIYEKKPIFESLGGGGISGLPELFQAEYLLETGKLDKAALYSEKASSFINNGNQPVLLARLAMLQSRIHIAAGNLAEVWQPIEEAKQKLEPLKKSLDIMALDFITCRVASILNQEEKIPAWMRNTALTVPKRLFVNYGYRVIVQGRALLALKGWEALDVLLETAVRHIESDDKFSLLPRIHMYILLALQAEQHENVIASHNYLRQAVALARPDGLITNIAEYGIHLYPLMQQLHSMNPADEFLATLCKTTGKYVVVGVGMNELLNPRERSLLQSAVNGESNRSIGEKTGMAPGSVANALSRIYFKLGVNSRKEAKAMMRNLSRQPWAQAK